jgi:hypothetical protein
MIDLKLIYAFLSTYNETILRRVCIEGVWRLEHSPVIEHTTKGQTAKPTDFSYNVSVRECLWYVCIQARTGDHRAFNSVPANEWVRNFRG